VRNPAINLRLADCQGCPGFVLAYRNLVEKVRAIGANAAYQSQYSTVNTSPDMSRMRLVKKELVHLLGLLVDAGVEGLSKAMINDLNASNEIVVKLGPEKQEEKAPERKF
jgi:hypothetical protein